VERNRKAGQNPLRVVAPIEEEEQQQRQQIVKFTSNKTYLFYSEKYDII
jgi:hypothetical protein